VLFWTTDGDLCEVLRADFVRLWTNPRGGFAIMPRRISIPSA